MRLKQIVLAGSFLLASSGAAWGGPFVPGVAVNDAGKIADESKKEFFAFYIPTGSAVESTSAEISKHLAGAAKAKANLAILGPDYALNAKILKAALAPAPKDSLTGATILTVGDSEEVEAELKAAATAAGTTIRATKYSGK